MKAVVAVGARALQKEGREAGAEVSNQGKNGRHRAGALGKPKCQAAPCAWPPEPVRHPAS